METNLQQALLFIGGHLISNTYNKMSLSEPVDIVLTTTKDWIGENFDMKGIKLSVKLLLSISQ